MLASKQGEVGIAGQLVVIISVVVGLMLVSGAVMKAYARAQDKEPEVLCRNSVALRASTQLNINNALLEAQVKPVPILCKTVDVKIKGEREELKQQVAEKIAKCWQMFGEGRFEEPFKGQRVDVVPSLLGTADQPNQCFNCYYLLVDQRTIKNEQGQNVPISAEELLQYMVAHHPTWVNESVNYLKYIQSYGGPGMMISILPQGIEPGKGYTISFLPKNTVEGRTNWVAWIGLGTAFAGGVACGIVTAGGCLPFIMTALSAAGTAGGVAVGYELVRSGGSTSYQLPDGTMVDQNSGIPLSELFEKREFSSIYISEGTLGQRFCGSADLAGN